MRPHDKQIDWLYKKEQKRIDLKKWSVQYSTMHEHNSDTNSVPICVIQAGHSYGPLAWLRH